jgi:multiple sugar transport system substrate-binding protein
MKYSVRACLMASMLVFAGASQAVTTIKYVMWDPNQLPVYGECAKIFEQANPDIKIDMKRLDWEAYWKALDEGMARGEAPDVFVNHLANVAKLMRDKRLVDLQPLIDRDKPPLNIFVPQLLKGWSREGKQYGLPKDWDTIALVVNLDHAKAAGVTKAELENMTWNPTDGGTFEKIITRLTRDSSGRSFETAGFDPKSVAVMPPRKLAACWVKPPGATLPCRLALNFNNAHGTTRFIMTTPNWRPHSPGLSIWPPKGFHLV